MSPNAPIVYIIHSLPRGGAERLVIDQVNELHRRGIRVHLVTLSFEKKNSLLGECLLPEGQRTMVAVGSFYNPRSMWLLAKKLRELRPRVVVTHLWFANTVGRIAAFLSGIPVVAFEHNVYDAVKSRTQFALDRLLRHVSCRIVAVSVAVRDSLVRHGIPNRDIVVIHNGVSLARFSPSSQARDSTPFSFLSIGRLNQQKGMDALLRAVARIPACRLSIAGEGEERGVLEKLASQLGIAHRVDFLGVRSDIPELMQKADSFVLASRWEGFGIVLVEALASGLPVIVTRVGGAEEIITDGVNGLLVPPGDEGALVDAMETIIADVDLRAKLRASAPLGAAAYSIERNVTELLDTLSSCV